MRRFKECQPMNRDNAFTKSRLSFNNTLPPFAQIGLGGEKGNTYEVSGVQHKN